MIITFNGTVIAQEQTEGGTDSVEGFFPSGEQQVQIAEFLRATDAMPFARGNRVHTLKGTITPNVRVPSSSPLTLVAMLQKFAGLPPSGTLTFAEGGYSVTFANAVLKSFESTRDGSGYSIDVTFVAGAPSATVSPQPLVTDAGTPIPTDAGAPIIENAL